MLLLLPAHYYNYCCYCYSLPLLLEALDAEKLKIPVPALLAHYLLYIFRKTEKFLPRAEPRSEEQALQKSNFLAIFLS